MKNILVTICLGIIIPAFSQDKASIKVKVMDFQKSVKGGEIVVFQSEDKSIKLSGRSNKEGIFNIALPGGHTYDILIQKIGVEIKNNTITIPKLAPGAQYNEATLSIFFEMPKSITLDNLEFDSGKHSIKPKSHPQLNELAKFLIQNPNRKIEIQGHTDNVGNPESNKILSQKRAESVREFLTLKGINIKRIICKGFGDTRPIAPNNLPSGRQKNRRTEIRFI